MLVYQSCNCRKYRSISISESHLRSRGSCISRSLVLLPRILLTTVIFCLMLVVARWGLIPTTSGSCSCHEHITNLATGVSRLLVLDCGMTFHLGFGGRDSSSIPLDDLWKHIFFWQLKRLVTLSTYRRYTNNCIYLSANSCVAFLCFITYVWNDSDTPLFKIISCITFNCFSVPISYTVDSSGLAVST